eukprot:2455855-Amphidinium_carterae.5
MKKSSHLVHVRDSIQSSDASNFNCSDHDRARYKSSMSDSFTTTVNCQTPYSRSTSQQALLLERVLHTSTSNPAQVTMRQKFEHFTQIQLSSAHECHWNSSESKLLSKRLSRIETNSMVCRSS